MCAMPTPACNHVSPGKHWRRAWAWHSPNRRPSTRPLGTAPRIPVTAVLLAARSIDAVLFHFDQPHVIDVVFARRPEWVEHDADVFHLGGHRGRAERLGPAGIGLPLVGPARGELALPDVFVNERLEVAFLLHRLA